MVAIAVVTGALGVVQTLLSNQVGQRVMHDLRTAVYEHLQRLSLAFFTRTRTGRGAVAARERHRRRPGGRHLDGDVDRLERDDGAGDRGGACSSSTGS